ncbi:MAG: septum formation initiator family protein [Eubacterium sp.]|nr:septum formation initiator family protein [Eubacterium sp.]
MNEKMKKTRKSFSFKSFFSSKKNISFILITVLLIGAFGYFGIKTVNQNSDISRLEIQKQELEQKLEEQEQDNKELQAVLDNENKDDYIEQKAREKGYVKSDEVVFYDISSSVG